jgi:hypothetical protein
MFIFRRSVVRPLAALILTLSLRKLWTIYECKVVAPGRSRSRRDIALAQLAFYSGAGGVLKVLAHMIERGDSDAALRTIRRFGKQAMTMQSFGAARAKLQ